MTNKITIKAGGPVVVQGTLRLEDADGHLLNDEQTLYLCRCGNSKNSPYCDGSHKQSDAELTDRFSDTKQETLDTPGSLTITVRKNAMLIVKGPMVIEGAESGSRTTRNKAALCRCGHSGNKPFCDASHKRCDFRETRAE